MIFKKNVAISVAIYNAIYNATFHFRNLRKKSTVISYYFSFLIPERNEYGK